ncbi:MAG: FtsW/RodA/SpoVE family cell cycle protein [Bacteroidales bacterium]|jgi:cell division protein FtsW|nr:FtsW/RodA/SpoVE family cell cycle protein [Bacteroidales bacterium]MBR4176516.1 FtsW/RodA/SpoVE family cell cycle protein [Bacteroidales bacterium]MBR4715527.1 FtsW/RodA/SpoVE family cell cycle protein [Bacteroidales bacterium]MCR4931231.1 FtsW/RodA/SpoVE family cell cycle protein [Bacteroidales bacterium]
MAKDRQDISRKLLNPFKGDKAIWFIFLVLAIISLISVFSSIGYSAVISDRTPEQAFVRHLMFVVVTFVVVILLSNFNYRQFSRASWFGYIISIALLIAVFVIGHKSNESGSGMSRWLMLPLVGRFQPSELAKVIVIIYLARLLAQEKDNLKEWTTFRNILIPIFIITVLILSENLSTAVIIFFVCLAMLRLAPINVKHWRLTILALVVCGALALVVGEKMNIPFLARSETWANRIDNWLNFNDQELSQESMARMAVASGKFFGVGIGSTIQARLMTQANNDLIYAIIIEESGMLGGIIVLLLYVYLYIRCIKIAMRCKGDFGRMTVIGLGTLIFLQAAIHMSVSVGALPVTGQTLPFISSGGTAYLCMGLALGVIQAVAYDVNLSEAKAKKETNAVPVDSDNIEPINPPEGGEQ